MMAMMYMYSSGLPLVPYFPVIPSAYHVPPQCTGQTPYLHQPSPTIRREEMNFNGYKGLSCPMSILADPPPPSDGAVEPGTHDSTSERATSKLALAGDCSLSTAERGAKEAGCGRSPSAPRDKNQLKFGIERILGHSVSSATERTDKKAAVETYEAADRDRTNNGAFETVGHSGLTSQVIACNGWRGGRAGDHSPVYTGRSTGDHAPPIEMQLPRKYSPVSDYCRGCYQLEDKAALVHNTCDPWSYAQYAYRLDHNHHPYTTKESPHRQHPRHPQLPVQPHHAGPVPNARLAGRRKRSWSRAVFTSLQRKGLEKRFELQKYVNKPDRRQLAAALGLTDAQVKVWFQNRRMKWRHFQRMEKQQMQAADTSSPGGATRLTDACSGTDDEDPAEERCVRPTDSAKDGPVERDRFTVDNHRGFDIKDTLPRQVARVNVDVTAL